MACHNRNHCFWSQEAVRTGMDSTSQKVLMALLQSLLDSQCSWPVLETPSVSTTLILASKLRWQPVLTQFLMTSRTLHVAVILSILQDILAVHVTMVQNVILRSGLKLNQNFINPWIYILMTFCTSVRMLREQSCLVLPVSKKDFQDQVSYRVTSILGYQSISNFQAILSLYMFPNTEQRSAL
jgi:hypothetical protein